MIKATLVTANGAAEFQTALDEFLKANDITAGYAERIKFTCCIITGEDGRAVVNYSALIFHF